jgi:hypothetical protein
MTAKRLLASWRTPAIIAGIVVLAFGVWVTPTPHERVVVDPATGNATTVTIWDTSRFQAVAAFWWQALLLALSFVALLCAGWGNRGRLVARASAAPFFAASLLVHALLVLSLGAVPLARAVVEHAEVIRVAQAQLLDEPVQPAAGGGNRPAFEKVADLKAEDTANPQLIRQAAAAAPAPEVEALVPTLPAHAIRGLPPERLMFVPPRPVEVIRQPMEIERRGPVAALKPIEIKLDTPEPPPPEKLPKESPLPERQLVQGRQEPTLPLSGGAEPLKLPELKRGSADLRPEAMPIPKVSAKEELPAALGRREPGRIALATPPEPDAVLKPEPAPKVGAPAAWLKCPDSARRRLEPAPRR